MHVPPDRHLLVLQPTRFCNAQCTGCYLQPHIDSDKALEEVRQTKERLKEPLFQGMMSKSYVGFLFNYFQPKKTNDVLRKEHLEILKDVVEKTELVYLYVNKIGMDKMLGEILEAIPADLLKQKVHLIISEHITGKTAIKGYDSFKEVSTALLWDNGPTSKKKVLKASEEYDDVRIVVPKPSHVVSKYDIATLARTFVRLHGEAEKVSFEQVNEKFSDFFNGKIKAGTSHYMEIKAILDEMKIKRNATDSAADFDEMVALANNPKIIIDPCFLFYSTTRINEDGDFNLDKPAPCHCAVTYIEAGSVHSCMYKAKVKVPGSEVGICCGLDSPKSRRAIVSNLAVL